MLCCPIVQVVEIAPGNVAHTGMAEKSDVHGGPGAGLDAKQQQGLPSSPLLYGSTAPGCYVFGMQVCLWVAGRRRGSGGPLLHSQATAAVLRDKVDG